MQQTRTLLIIIFHIFPLQLVHGAGMEPQLLPVEGDIAFVGVNVVPMDEERVIHDQTLVVKDGLITAMGNRNSIRLAKEVFRINLTGQYLLPGLADMHAHLRGGQDMEMPETIQEQIVEHELILFLATGITTVRDPAGGPIELNLRNRIRSGKIVGPRLWVASPLLDGDPPTIELSGITEQISVGVYALAKPQQAAPLVGKFKDDGYDMLKVYAMLSKEVYVAIVNAAQQYDFPVIGHVPFDVRVEGVLEAGQRSIEHFRGYDFDGVNPDRAKKGITPERYRSWHAMTDERMHELARMTVAAGAWNTPTFMVNEFITQPEARKKLLADPLIRYITPKQRRELELNVVDKVFAEVKEAMRGSLAQRQKFLRVLDGEGAPLLTGTDTAIPYLLPGYTVIDELQRFVEAGLTPFRALRAATVEPARYFAESDIAGTVAVGKRADLLLVKANPLTDVSHLRQMTGVMIKGKWLSKEAMQMKLDEIAEFNKSLKNYLQGE